MVVSFFITSGQVVHAVSIGLSELLTKVVLYYLHERGWILLLQRRGWSQTPRISFIKAVSWRLLGSIDTFFLATLITGNAFTGLKIGGTELLTKIVLYYLHERAWARLPEGSVRKWFGKN